jgi:hypothetical protein
MACRGKTFASLYRISYFFYIGKPTYLSMPELLAGRHYNEEEISRDLEKEKKRKKKKPA